MNKTECPEEIITAYKKCTDEKKKRVLYLSAIDAGMEFVKNIAAQTAKQSNVPGEDLVQVGSIGLIKAIDFYNTDKNAKFKTYAAYLIKGEIMHYLRDKASVIRSARGETAEDVLSLDDEEFSKIPAGDYQEFLTSYEDKITLTTAIEKLPDELRQVIELSYYEDLNQREIADRLKISPMQVSRLLKKALSGMYETIGENDGDPATSAG